MERHAIGTSADDARMGAAMKIVDLKKDMDAKFAGVDARIQAMDARIEARHETTLRHIDIWGEQIRSELRLYSEQAAAMLQRFDALLAENARDHANFMRIFENHEARIASVERNL
jgi:hypothetical protein